MIVTINTDASFNNEHKVGGYAYWIVHNGARVKRGGLLKECNNNTEAEMKAIANALYRLTQLHVSGISKIIVNTDNKPAIDLLTGQGKTKKEALISVISACDSYIMQLKLDNKIVLSNSEYIEYRYVAAHSKATDSRSFVNDWCDKVAKDFVKKYILKPCQSKNSQPDPG
jgi:ribonuclease HI